MRERRRVTVPAAATPASRIHSPAMIATAPTIQAVAVMCPGTSSGTPMKRTGSQLRLRKSRAPMRALRVRSAAEIGATFGEDMATK